MGRLTALITMKADSLARLSCNPAIGGLGKSQIVHEIDALGGEIGCNADYTAIHCRMLNTRKGPAVQAIRSQCDKDVYSHRMTATVRRQHSLDIIEGQVVQVLVSNDGSVRGVALEDGRRCNAASIVLCPGTFLRGVIHIGKISSGGGRAGDAAAEELSRNLADLGFEMGRLKTGTPPRLHRHSLDYDLMNRQDSDSPPPLFSVRARMHKELFHVEQGAGNEAACRALFHVEQSLNGIPLLAMKDAPVCCYLTDTTSQTHELVSRHLEDSALYGGMITGTGVRYCPSIEDKIVKFPQRDSHHVFIEPEGLLSDRVYPNGISNSLPAEVQEKLVRSIPGLANAQMIRAGYAIEYDYVYPTELQHTLETRRIGGLFLAGQINGTTGYEEAAGQGFVAGVNAALRARGEEHWVLNRTEAYIGVMIDDLVSKGTEEPYRMFTSRAEYRLTLRQDNAALRLRTHAARLGIVSKEMQKLMAEKVGMIATEIERLSVNFHEGISLAQWLRRPEMTYYSIPGHLAVFPEDLAKQVETDVKYDGYMRREGEQIQRLVKMYGKRIPGDFEYRIIGGLRHEARVQLERYKPGNLGEASRIPGVNPADIAVLSTWLQK